MRRILLIINPAAARTRSKVAEAVISVLRREGCAVDVVETRQPGDAAGMAAVGVGDGVDAVAVYGGDGTVMQAVASLIGHDIPIGLIPGGTGNLLAGNLRLPKNPREAARIVAHGRPRVIDVGKVERASGVRYFAVACGAGFDAELMAHTSGEAKRRWGFAAYLARAWHLVKDTAPVPHTVTVDGRVLNLEASSVMVANCSEFIPPVLRLGPGIALDDGVLDALIFNARGVAEAVQVMLKLFTRRVDGSMIRHVRGQEVRVESTPPRPVELDGEVDGETPFTATVVHKALSVLVPAESR